MNNFLFARNGVLLAFGFCLAATTARAQQLFTTGDIVVSLYGNTDSTTASYFSSNSALTDGAPTPITLEEFSPTISANADENTTPLVTDTLPTTDGVGGSANVGVVGEYGSSSEGTLQLSGNDEYLTIGGYDAPQSAAFYTSPSTQPLAQSSSTYGTSYSVARVAALVDANGNVNSSTVLDNIYNTQNIRGAYSYDGTSVYVSGQSGGTGTALTSTQGIFNAATGDNTSAGGGTAPSQVYSSQSTRDIEEYGGNLYFSEDQKSASTGIFEYSGTPTNSGQAPTQVTGATATVSSATVSGSAFTINSGTVNLSPEGFYFASSTVLYVADTGDPKTKGVGDGGIQKWTLNVNSGVWSLAYTITSPNFLNPTTVNPTSGNGTAASSGETGLEAITGEVVNGVAQLYAVSYTAGDDNANGLYGLSDTLSATTPTNGEQLTELAEAPGGTSSTSYNFKGVSFAPVATPEPSTWVLLGAAFAGLAWFHRRRQQA